jgi:hypothetical protein
LISSTRDRSEKHNRGYALFGCPQHSHATKRECCRGKARSHSHDVRLRSTGQLDAPLSVGVVPWDHDQRIRRARLFPNEGIKPTRRCSDETLQVASPAATAENGTMSCARHIARYQYRSVNLLMTSTGRMVREIGSSFIPRPGHERSRRLHREVQRGRAIRWRPSLMQRRPTRTAP